MENSHITLLNEELLHEPLMRGWTVLCDASLKQTA